MAQEDILISVIITLFQDVELKNLMLIPDTEINNLISFRDNYCIADATSSTLIDSESQIPCKLVISWMNMSESINPYVFIRPIHIDIFVQKEHQYDVSTNSLVRRQDKIQQRLKQLLGNKSVEGFKMTTVDFGDLISPNINYSKSFILFTVKNILSNN